ncbi:YcxB family protein [Aerosakkonemataceae cyanobacterium BLCC-F50]|uniref:YcxB family protein n=1 Tax=Floridaenema flaviceps BLCC-F50 TaxID=3153642 RepID=A0ABV4XSB1_9CYAN
MKLEYQLTFNDYLEANQNHSKWRKILMWIIAIFFFILGLLSIIIIPAEPSSYIFLVLGICYIPLVKLIERYNLARIWKSQPSIREPITLEANEEGITLKSTLFESNIKWQVYTKFVETNKLLMLYQSNQSFNLLPKRAFSTNEQLNEFRELLRIKGIRSR